MKKRIAISAVLAVLLTAYAVGARWRTLGLGIYTLSTTVGKLLIHTWRPALILAVIAWIAMAVFISAQRKKALTEPRETRAEKKARRKAEKEAAKAEAKAAKKRESQPVMAEKQPEPISEVRPGDQGATVVLNRKSMEVPDEPVKIQESSVKEQEELAKEHPAALKVTTTRSGFCENCGAPMKENQRFCTKCGYAAGKEDTQ